VALIVAKSETRKIDSTQTHRFQDSSPLLKSSNGWRNIRTEQNQRFERSEPKLSQINRKYKRQRKLEKYIESTTTRQRQKAKERSGFGGQASIVPFAGNFLSATAYVDDTNTTIWSLGKNSAFAAILRRALHREIQKLRRIVYAGRCARATTSTRLFWMFLDRGCFNRIALPFACMYSFSRTFSIRVPIGCDAIATPRLGSGGNSENGNVLVGMLISTPRKERRLSGGKPKCRARVGSRRVSRLQQAGLLGNSCLSFVLSNGSPDRWTGLALDAHHQVPYP